MADPTGAQVSKDTRRSRVDVSTYLVVMNCVFCSHITVHHAPVVQPVRMPGGVGERRAGAYMRGQCLLVVSAEDAAI